MANRAYESIEALSHGEQPVSTKVFNLALYGRNQYSNKTTRKDSDTIFAQSINLIEKANGVTLLDGSACDLSRRWRETIGLLLVIGY